MLGQSAHAAQGDDMPEFRRVPMHPLTHHEILGLVEPFARRGRHPDLAATRRLERRLVFETIEHAGDRPGVPGSRESLALEQHRSGVYRLTRRVTLASGLEASLESVGSDPAALLEYIESVDWRKQFQSGPGYAIAEIHRVEPIPGARSGTRMVLLGGIARVAGLTLRMRAPTVRGVPAEMALEPMPGDPIDLPDDLLAVLGWDWGPLHRFPDGWRSTLRLPGREPVRSRRAEIRFERTVEHLARTLAEPPGQFHERLVAARWGVAARRTLPLLAYVGLLAAVIASSHVDLGQTAPIRLLIFSTPSILMLLVLSMREIPRLELPRAPHRSPLPQWRD